MENVLRRRLLGASLAAMAVAVTMSGCGGSTSGKDSASSQPVHFWTLKDPTNTVQQAGVDAFNGAGKGKVVMDVVPADGYLDKLRTAMGSDRLPGMFFSWGGGPMREYATAKKIVEVTQLPGGADLATHFLPSVLKIGETASGSLVGVPCRGTQPVFLFYNKKVFADAGVQPPSTWSDVQALIGTFKGKGIIPFAVAGQGASSWTELMWLEYLTDRLGGSAVFDRIQSGDASGWTDPAVLQAAQMIKQLVDGGAFGTKFGSVTYGSGGTSTLLSSGKAAMELMGSWEYAVQQGDSASFAKDGLGYVPFPSVEGGKGDPNDVVGNPSNYVSVTTAADATTAGGYLQTLYGDDYIKGLVKMGEVPVTTNAKDALSAAPDPAYAQFQFDLVQKAPAFTQSWDQALGFKIATPMLAELQKLFNGESTPQQFVSAASALK
jgi:xylobiose transport system substrate-binding protein